jgi:hypothetical protein
LKIQLNKKESYSLSSSVVSVVGLIELAHHQLCSE